MIGNWPKSGIRKMSLKELIFPTATPSPEVEQNVRRLREMAAKDREKTRELERRE